MIHSLKVENFQSINKQVCLNFVVDNNAPQSDKYLAAFNNTRVSTVEAILGANASGKTSILKALSLVRWLLTDSFVDRGVVESMYSPYSGLENKPTYIEVNFESQNNLYLYTVRILGDKIIDEKMVQRSFNNVRTSSKTIFSREWNNEKKEYTFNYKKSGLNTPFEKIPRWILEDASLTTIGATYGDEQLLEIASYWQNVETNIDPSDQFMFYGQEVRRVINKRSRKSGDLDNFLGKLKAYDESIMSFDDGGIKYRYANEKQKKLKATELSSGTAQLIVILDKLESALESGGVAIIDEFDAYLHPVWLADLVTRFFDKSINTNGAQLITSTHNPQILNLLDKYQINITERPKGQTVLYRLDEIEGIRPDDNFFANYLAGKYGGIPLVL